MYVCMYVHGTIGVSGTQYCKYTCTYVYIYVSAYTCTNIRVLMYVQSNIVHTVHIVNYVPMKTYIGQIIHNMYDYVLQSWDSCSFYACTYLLHALVRLRLDLLSGHIRT